MLRRVFALYLAGQSCAAVPTWAQAPEDPLLAAAEQFLQLAAELQRLPRQERVAAVNRRINQLVDYGDDLDLCGRRDCWQTPAETLAVHRGDCEDYAIAKFFLLQACGLSADTRLAYATWQPRSRARPAEPVAHAVVTVDVRDGDPVVLDCLDPPLAPWSNRSDLRAIFSFDAHDLWRGTTAERVGDAPARLLPWRGVLQRWARQQRAASLHWAALD